MRGDLEAVANVVRARRAPTRRLRFVYEAGPCGFGIHRDLTAALQALRGVSFITAVGLVTEVGDIRRFAHPRALMAYLGLVPSEYSSGPSVRRGGITKAGNPHARRLLAEAAWAYHGVPRIGRQMLYRQEALPKAVCDIAWKAQLRLTARFRRVVARGKAKPKVATAIARELRGFIWAIAREVPPPPAYTRPCAGPSGRRHRGSVENPRSR